MRFSPMAAEHVFPPKDPWTRLRWSMSRPIQHLFFVLARVHADGHGLTVSDSTGTSRKFPRSRLARDGGDSIGSKPSESYLYLV